MSNYRRTLLISLGCAALLAPAATAAAPRVQTLRFYDRPVSMTLTHADGTVVTKAPFPEAQPGDTLDVDSIDYRGNHKHHAKHWTGSTHLRCVFQQGPPACESHFALGGSMLVITGNPGVVTNGTGIYQGATGRVISAKQLPRDATDFVLRVKLRR